MRLTLRFSLCMENEGKNVQTERPSPPTADPVFFLFASESERGSPERIGWQLRGLDGVLALEFEKAADSVTATPFRYDVFVRIIRIELLSQFADKHVDDLKSGSRIASAYRWSNISPLVVILCLFRHNNPRTANSLLVKSSTCLSPTLTARAPILTTRSGCWNCPTVACAIPCSLEPPCSR